MSSIINNGLTGLTAHQTALSTTAHNIANANNEGYSRQVTSFATNNAVRKGDMSVGTGVTINGITRVTNQFVINQVRENTVAYNEMEMYHSNAATIDSLIADQSTGVMPTVEEFFGALQDASADPGSLPLRQVVLSESEVMVGRFNVLQDQLADINSLTNQEMGTLVEDINVLAQSIADMNRAITSNDGGTPGSAPNDLLDKRDEALKELGSLVGIAVIDQNDGTIGVTIGTGQPLVVGTRARQLDVAIGEPDGTMSDVVFLDSQGGNGSVITRQITGGQLGGLLTFRDEVLQPSFRELGRVAIALAETVNEEHRKGMDFEGDTNTDFFVDINDRLATTQRVVPSSTNSPPGDHVLSVTIEDLGELTTEDYTLTFPGPNDDIYIVTRGSDKSVAVTGSIGNTFPISIEFEGIAVHLEGGNFQQGDKFLLQPVRNGAANLALQVSTTQDIAFSSPVLAQSETSNSGSGVITPGEVLDINSPAFSNPGSLSPPLIIKFNSDTSYDVLDNSNPAEPVQLDPPMRNQVFVPGFDNAIFSEAPDEFVMLSAGPDIAQANILSADNGYAAETLNVRYRDPATLVVTTLPVLNTAAGESAQSIAAKINTAYDGIEASAHTEVTLGNLNAATTDVIINGETLSSTSLSVLVTGINNNAVLQGQGLSAELKGTEIVLRSNRGDDIVLESVGGSIDVQGTTAGAGVPATVGGEVKMILDEGFLLSTTGNGVFEASPTSSSNYRGYQASINGKPQAGDTFSINFNSEGLSDNRTLLKMIGLQSKGVLEEGRSTYGDSYGSLVENIGSKTKESSIASETQKSLLIQSEQRQQSMSGVNLDEEASNLVRYEVAYNAAAQVISIARSLFDTLIATFR